MEKYSGRLRITRSQVWITNITRHFMLERK
jgi:hypothetical protein